MQELKAEARTNTGKSVKTLRQAGFLPAVLYGEGVESRAISVPARDFEKVYKEAGESTLLKINLDHTNHTVLIHDIAYDPLRGNPIHADFYAVSMDKILRIPIPILFFGESPAVKNEGGILVKVAHEIEVEAMPADLPHELRADLGRLTAIHARILVSDLPHAPNVRIMADEDEVVAIVEPPRSDEAMAELSAAPASEIKEVKTEREVKVAEKPKEAEAEAE